MPPDYPSSNGFDLSPNYPSSNGFDLSPDLSPDHVSSDGNTNWNGFTTEANSRPQTFYISFPFPEAFFGFQLHASMIIEKNIWYVARQVDEVSFSFSGRHPPSWRSNPSLESQIPALRLKP